MKFFIRLGLSLLLIVGFVSVYAYTVGGLGISFLLIEGTAFFSLIILVTVLTRLQYSFKEQYGFFRLAVSEKKDEGDLNEALLFFKTLQSRNWAVGVLICFWAIVCLMVSLEDTSQVGPNLAVSLLVLIYVALIHIIVLQPIVIDLEKKKLSSLDKS